MLLRALVLSSLLFTGNAFAQTFTTETVVTIKVDLDQPQLDVLFVVDDSGSMSYYQAVLASSAGLIANKLSSYKDVNAAVVTTSIGFPGSVGGSGKFVAPVVNSRDPNFEKDLAKNLIVGTSGDADEKPLEAIAVALSDQMLKSANQNFIRPNADLLIIVVTDAYDQSKLNVNDVAAQLQALKGNNHIYLAASFANPTDTACVTEYYDPGLGDKIGDLSQLLNGKLFSLCANMQQNLLHAIPSDKEYKPLSEVLLPVLPGKTVNFDSIVVTADEVIPSGDLYTGWIFDSKKSSLIFGVDVDYGSADFLTVTYKMK